MYCIHLTGNSPHFSLTAPFSTNGHTYFHQSSKITIIKNVSRYELDLSSKNLLRSPM